MERVKAAAGKAGERVWEMPLFDEYREQIKSPIADMKNVGGRPAGPITAAMFLKEFVGETPWVHLDIAGTSWNEGDLSHMAKGPTGVAVRTLVQLCRDFSITV
jgi:leucyl aminopeptidase